MRLALEFADAKTWAAYSRVGVCNSKQGTLGDLPSAVMAEEIETPGERTDPSDVHLRGQPGAFDAKRQTT